MQELVYTSTPRGIEKGSSGFCTVACSRSIARPLKSTLESISAYKEIYPAHHEKAYANPVNYSYLKLKTSSGSHCIFSRIAFAGVDYTGRSNKIAHHICLDANDVNTYSSLSPATIISKKNTFFSSWDEDPQYFEKDWRTLATGEESLQANYWREVTGDSGWAAHLAEQYTKAPGNHLYIVYDEGVDPLKLIKESIVLLDKEDRWDVTFSTYFTEHILGSDCKWRCVLRGSKKHQSLGRGENIIDLNSLIGKKFESAEVPMAEVARTGIAPKQSSSSSSDSTSTANAKNKKGKVFSASKRAKRTYVQNDDSAKKLRAALIALLIIGVVGALCFLVMIANKNSNKNTEKSPVQQVKVPAKVEKKIEAIEPVATPKPPVEEKVEEEVLQFTGFKIIGNTIVVDSGDFFRVLNDLKQFYIFSPKIFKKNPNVSVSKKFKGFRFKDDTLQITETVQKSDGSVVKETTDIFTMTYKEAFIFKSKEEVSKKIASKIKKSGLKLNINKLILEFK